MRVWMYFTTDGDSGYYNIRLFKNAVDAELWKKSQNDVYGQVVSIEVHEW